MNNLELVGKKLEIILHLDKIVFMIGFFLFKRMSQKSKTFKSFKEFLSQPIEKDRNIW